MRGCKISAMKKYKNKIQRTKAKTEQTDAYHKRSMVQFSFRLHKESDADAIAKINSVPNKADYFRQLVNKDLKGE